MCLVPHITRDILSTNVENGPRGFFEFVMPPVDIIEDGAELIVRIDLPGFEKNDINIRIVENTLSISAKRESPPSSGTVYYRHRPVTINRKIILPISPKDYHSEKLVGSATYIDGVVTLRIPSKNRIMVT